MAYTRRAPRTTIIAALALAALATEASAQQQRSYYDSAGRSLGRSTTGRQGTVTNTDARGKVISRVFTSGRTMTRAGAMSAAS
jgi:YD repeat-containing protein